MLVLDCPVEEKDWRQETLQANGLPERRLDPSDPDSTMDAGLWEAAVCKIVGFQHLGDDWDGLGAKAPTRDLLASAIGLAYLLSEDGVAAPRAIVAGVDGSVTFEWQEPDGTYAEVEVVRPLYAEVMLIEPGKAAKHWTLPTK
jgi:hypothetical protein